MTTCGKPVEISPIAEADDFSAVDILSVLKSASFIDAEGYSSINQKESEAILKPLQSAANAILLKTNRFRNYV